MVRKISHINQLLNIRFLKFHLGSRNVKNVSICLNKKQRKFISIKNEAGQNRTLSLKCQTKVVHCHKSCSSWNAFSLPALAANLAKQRFLKTDWWNGKKRFHSRLHKTDIFCLKLVSQIAVSSKSAVVIQWSNGGWEKTNLCLLLQTGKRATFVVHRK